MGAWGTGVFENDTASDWAFALEESDDGLALIEETLDRVLAAAGDFLDSWDAEEALAAAETIARVQGNTGARSAYTEPMDNWVAANRLKIPAALAQKAHAAIDRILSPDSELVELWEESEGDGEWKQAVASLRSRICI